MLMSILEFAFLGFVYGFIVRPVIKAKEESEALNDLIASYAGSGSKEDE